MGIVFIIIGIVEFIIILKLGKISIKNFKKYLPVAILYLISTIVNYIFISKIGLVKEIMYVTKGVGIEEITLFLVSMAIALVYSPIYVAILQKNHEKNIIKSYEKKTKVMEFEYYRDIIKKVPPGILMFVNNRKINVEDCVVATLLDLQIKKYIRIDNEKIVILKEIHDLLPYEELVLTKNDFEEKTFKKLFKECLMNEMVFQKYVNILSNPKEKNYNDLKTNIEKINDESNIAYFLEFPMGWMVVYVLTVLFLFGGLIRDVIMPDIESYTLVITLMVVSYFLVFLCSYIYKFIQNRINVIIRTEKSLELAAKIKGIKKYIEDYSNIKNNGIDMVNLYEEFVIYAIILDIKGKLNNECKELYNNIKNKIVIKEEK